MRAVMAAVMAAELQPLCGMMTQTTTAAITATNAFSTTTLGITEQVPTAAITATIALTTDMTIPMPYAIAAITIKFRSP